jgi:hypothetical protein
MQLESCELEWNVLARGLAHSNDNGLLEFLMFDVICHDPAKVLCLHDPT